MKYFCAFAVLLAVALVAVAAPDARAQWFEPPLVPADELPVAPEFVVPPAALVPDECWLPPEAYVAPRLVIEVEAFPADPGTETTTTKVHRDADGTSVTEKIRTWLGGGLSHRAVTRIESKTGQNGSTFQSTTTWYHAGTSAAAAPAEAPTSAPQPAAEPGEQSAPAPQKQPAAAPQQQPPAAPAAQSAPVAEKTPAVVPPAPESSDSFSASYSRSVSTSTSKSW